MRKRLKPTEASYLGLNVKPRDGARNPRYNITESEWQEVLNYRENKTKILFYDIETSPSLSFVWGAGWGINIPYDNIIETWKIICISYSWEGLQFVSFTTGSARTRFILKVSASYQSIRATI